MNCETNELINCANFNSEEMQKIPRELFMEVPKKYNKEAVIFLGKNKSVIVPNNQSPLARWAERVRRNQQKNKN